MVRVKICGMRREEDVAAAVEAGASALGFNFWKGTPRFIEPREAARMIAMVPEEIWKVGVFVDEDRERVLEIAAETGISILQFHGNESPEYWDRLESFNKIKAFKVKSDFQASELGRYQLAAAYLLDGSVTGMVGGTGQTFDWLLTEKAKTFGRILLAGGLNAKNVAEAARRVRPWGVDVCTGVETEPGKKDPELIRQFIQAVSAADESFEPATVQEQ